MLRNTYVAGLAIGMTLAAALSGRVEAQANTFVLDKPRYTLTMTADWDTVKVPEAQASEGFSILAKLAGLGGLAYVMCEPGTLPPNADSLAGDFSSLLGGNITKDSAGSMKLGKYDVKWQSFKYDSLPILSEMIRKQAPFIPPLRNGTFRVYYLVSDGYVFTMAGIKLLANGVPPYADIEAAIATLKLKPNDGNSGSVRFAAVDLGGGLWVRAGLLGGAWLAQHPAVAVDCFTLRGAYAGSARPDGEGAWMLPASREALVVVVRARDGQSRSVLAHP